MGFWLWLAEVATNYRGRAASDQLDDYNEKTKKTMDKDLMI